jgi:methylphosphotriester-DNA--protein-cysteine methyltransferase
MKQLRLILFILSIACYSNVLAQTVYTTKTGEKYHKGSCGYLKNSKKEITIDKAMELGYSACSVCKPRKNNIKTTSEATANAITTKEKSDATTKKTVATQCTGKTQAGKRCKRKTKNVSGRCYQH